MIRVMAEIVLGQTPSRTGFPKARQVYPTGQRSRRQPMSQNIHS